MHAVNIVDKQAPTEAGDVKAVPRLVLSRKVGESIQLGDDVVVTIVKVSGNRTVLAIEAPRSVVVRRSELLERIVATALDATGAIAAIEGA